MSESRRQKNEDRVAEQAARVMSDTKFQRLRTRPARTVLAITMIVLIFAIPSAWIALGSIAGIIAVLAGIVVWWMLRMSVRLVADLPEEFLDERQATLRNKGYVEAYRWFAGFIVILVSAGLIASIALGDDTDTWRIALDYDTVMGAFWMIEAAALSLPSIVLALRDRELPHP